MSIPAVNVLMPVFNGEKYLRHAIISILDQTFRDFEFLILDDASTDASVDIIEEFARLDSRIHLYRGEKLGAVPTLNIGLRLARAPLIARFDHDDISLPERLERQVRFLNEHPEVVCVGGAAEIIDGAGRYLTTIMNPSDDGTIQHLLLEGHCTIYHPAAMFRREQVLTLGGYDEAAALAEDVDLWLRLGETGQLANLSEPVIRYRLHDGSASEQYILAQTERAREACERAWKRRGITGSFKTGPPWRPTADRASQFAFAVQFGWWAFNSGEKSTALHYARKALRIMPWRIDGWKLLVCVYWKVRRRT